MKWTQFQLTNLLAGILILFLQTGSAREISLEVDPGTFAFSGHSIHLRWSPDALPDWRFGIGNYSMKFPQALAEMHPDNRSEGWEQQLKNGVGLFFERNLNKRGTFLGLQLATQTYRLSQEGETGSSTYRNLLVMPYAGFRWSPGQNGFYVQPWTGLGYAKKVSGSLKPATEKFRHSDIIPFLTVHVGYTF